MTIVNFSVTPTRALVAVDTLGGNKVHRQHINKLFPLPHANLLVCGRGSAALIARVSGVCGLAIDLDDAKRKLTRLIPNMYRFVWLLSKVMLVPPGAFSGGQEIYLFGWSEEAGEMQAVRFMKASSLAPWVVDDDIEESQAPGLHGQDDLTLSDPQQMWHAAGQQVRQSALEHPGWPIGGRLIVAELTRSALTIRSMGDLPAP
jgi:hypothetical protein